MARDNALKIDQDQEQTRADADTVAVLYRPTWPHITSCLTATTTALGIAYFSSNWLIPLAWLCATAIPLTLFFRLLLSYRRNPLAEPARVWMAKYTIQPFWLGFVWGLGYVPLILNNSPPGALIFYAFMHIAMIAGSVIVHCLSANAVRNYIWGSVSVPIILGLITGNLLMLELCAGLIIVGILGTFFSRSIRIVIMKALRDKRETRDLAEKLVVMNHEIDRLRKAAVEANMAKSLFLSSMSHEIRTPLNSIIGFSELMTGEVLGKMHNPKYLEYAQDIHDSGAHLLSLINDVLDLSKIEAGKFKLDMEIVDIVPVASTCIRLLAERAMEAGVSLKLEKVVQGCKILADERRMKQVVLNLVTNAIKFTPKGGSVVVTASIANDMAQLSVADTGIGMREEDIPKALSPFEQIDSDLSKTREGTGLGLPLTKNLVEMHNGTLTIQSALGKGTTVTVSLPILKMSTEKHAMSEV